jgi:hypothetical protein
MANFLGNSGNGAEKCAHKLDHETVLGDEEGWQTLHEITQKESNYLCRPKKFHASHELGELLISWALWFFIPKSIG